MFTQRKAEIITAALLSIVLSVALIVVGLQMTVHLFEQKKADNSLLLDNFADTVKDLSASQANENFSYFVRLTDEDMFMFFSAGREPIYLVHEEIPQHYYVFERPDVDECKDRACICLCKDGPFWGNDLTETKATGLTQKNIFENIGQPSSASNGGLPCMQVTCVGDPIPKETIFGNSRGERRDFVYFQEIHDAVDKSNKDGRQIYYPIPLDILILINDDDAKQHDIFFSTVVGKNYNYEEQESSYVNLLIRDYAWDGGVIIGGMGYADEKHAKKKELIPPKVVFRFEKHIGINNVLGVCIHDHCLFPTTITKLQAKSNVASIDQQIIQSFTTLEDGFIKKFDQCVKAKQQSQIQTCYQELDKNRRFSQSQFISVIKPDTYSNF